MKEIKFRGKNNKNEWVYGDLAHVELRTTKGLIQKIYILNHLAHGGMLYIGYRSKVNPDSIEQFVGLDDNGNEIYEKI